MCLTNVVIIAWHYRKNVVHEAFYHIGPVAEASFYNRIKSARAVGRLCGFRSEKLTIRS